MKRVNKFIFLILSISFSCFVFSDDLMENFYKACRELPSKASNMDVASYERSNVAPEFVFYTHNPVDLTDNSKDKCQQVGFNGVCNYLKYLRLSENNGDIVSLHDVFEKEGDFWSFYNNFQRRDVGLPLVVMSYFNRHPDKLNALSTASAIYPEVGYCSNNKTGTLFGILTQLFLSIKKSKNQKLLIAYKKEGGHLFSDELSDKGCVYYKGYQHNVKKEINDLEKWGDDKKILNAMIRKYKISKQEMSRRKIVEELIKNLNVTSNMDHFTTQEFEKALECDNKLGNACRLHAKAVPDVVDIKSALFSSLKDELPFMGVEEVQLRNFINSNIGEGGIDDLAVLLSARDAIPAYNLEGNNLSMMAIDVDEISEYIDKNKNKNKQFDASQAQLNQGSISQDLLRFKNNRITPLENDFNRRDVKLEDESCEGLFFISTGAKKIEKGVDELVRKTPISAKELCNDGVSVLNKNKMHELINSYSSMINKRPEYMGVDDIKFTSFFSRDPLYVSILQSVGFASGYSSVTIHPDLKFKNMSERSFDLQSIFTEETISTFKEAVTKAKCLTPPKRRKNL